MGKVDKDFMRTCVYGLAVGDALGVPYEFMKRGTFECTGMSSGGTHRKPAGTWSDDTSMTLCVASSLKELGRVDCDDILRRFRHWLYRRRYTCDGTVFDVGLTCDRAIHKGRGSISYDDCGNGSVMRTAPVAALDGWTAQDAVKVSNITHAHPVAASSCVALCDMLQLLKERGPAGIDNVRRRYGFIADVPMAHVKSDGYCAHTLEAAIWCLCNTNSYERCVLDAVNFGDDTDTTAAVAGALAAAAYGFGSIPELWLAQLRGKDVIDECI